MGGAHRLELTRLDPGELGLAHQTDEWCLVSRIEAPAEIYRELARRWTQA